jgi:tRNA (guanine37-N1)-methyltransferase
MESISLVVPKKKAEPVRRKLIEKGVLRRDLQIRSDAKSVYLPVTQRIDLGYPIEKMDFKEMDLQVSDYRLLVDVPEEIRPLLPSSFDTVGSIAIVKMEDEVAPYAAKIGKAIMATQISIKTVCMDSGVIDEFRTRDVKVVAGEKTTETIHKEYGLTFKVDVARAFFTPRLATERQAVAKQVKPGEVVIDMFAGIGPFSIMIAKTGSPRIVYAIDVNPDAIELMKENIALNKAASVSPMLGDAREVVRGLEKADHVVMNLPHDGRGFIGEAIRALKPGGVIHFYEITEDDEVQKSLDEIADAARREGRLMKELARRRIKSYSPTMTFYGFDLQFL